MGQILYLSVAEKPWKRGGAAGEHLTMHAGLYWCRTHRNRNSTQFSPTLVFQESGSWQQQQSITGKEGTIKYAGCKSPFALLI